MCNYRYRAKNKKTNTRSKEHRMDNPSPNEKSFAATDEYFPVANTTTSPVSLPAVVPIPRIGLDIPYNPTFPPNGTPYPTNGTSFPNPQTLFPVSSNTYPTEIYNSNAHNIVFANGGQYYQSMSEFNASNSTGQNMELNKQRSNWEQAVSTYLMKSSPYNFLPLLYKLVQLQVVVIILLISLFINS